jgi:hypothetical protein
MITATSVEQVHEQLAYTEADATALRKVKRIWAKLETSKAKASKGDPVAIKGYFETLQKSLGQARLQQPVPNVEQESVSFWAWYEQECSSLKVTEFEVNRGGGHLAWCEKWLPAERKEFDAAISRIVEMPSYQNFAEAKLAATKMLRAYVETLQGS